MARYMWKWMVENGDEKVASKQPSAYVLGTDVAAAVAAVAVDLFIPWSMCASTFSLNRVYYFSRVYSRAHTNTHHCRRRSRSRYPGSSSVSMSMCKIECYDVNRSRIFLFRSLHTMRNMLQASRLCHVGLFGWTNTSTYSVSFGIGKSW